MPSMRAGSAWLNRSRGLVQPRPRPYTEADSGLLVTGGANCIADHVCLLRYSDGRRIHSRSEAARSVIAIALMLSNPRTVTEGVTMCTGLSAPSRIGPRATEP